MDFAHLIGMFLAVQQEMRQAAARVVAGTAGADQEVGIGAIADPGFFAVQNEVVTIAARAGLDLQHVGAYVGLRDADAAKQFTADQARQVALAQMRRGEFLDHLRAKGVDQHRHRQVGRGRGDLLEQHDHGEPVQTHAAMRFADRARDQAERRELAHDGAHQFARHELVAVVLAEQWFYFGGQKTAQTLDGGLLFFGSDDMSHRYSLKVR